MNIDFNRISHTYGDDIIDEIKDNIDDVTANIVYLTKLGFNDIEDIFESFAILFVDDPSSFKEKIDSLINELGTDYVEKLENDADLWTSLF